MIDRYCDIMKFIADSDNLKIVDSSYVYISKEEDYDIAIDLDHQVHEFERLKPYIAFLTKHICELDNTAQRFNSFLFPNIRQFPYDLEIIYIDKPNIVRLEYWGTTVNTQFDAVFEYRDHKFILIKMGTLTDIPNDWDKKSDCSSTC